MSEDQAPTAAGWYPLPDRNRRVGYWNGTSWTGLQRRASRDGTGPLDGPGLVALILLIAGFVLTIALPFVFSLLPSTANFPASVSEGITLVVLAATPVALILSIVGMVRGHAARVQTPMSLIAMILGIIGTIFLALPIALFVTGVWILPHI